MARKAIVPSVTASQALFILEKLIDEGTVSAADVRRQLASMWSEMSALQKRIAELRGAAEPVRHPARTVRKIATKVSRTAKKAVSPARRASMRLQGQYLALLLKVPKRDRAKYRTIAKQQGREKAIVAMKE